MPPMYPSPSQGLTVEYSALDAKKGKTVHVSDQVYQKGCVKDVQHGLEVCECVCEWVSVCVSECV